ncbi:asparaginase [Roseibium sp. MMSF_3544]|uniref:asparaginase n=1 Tax=unclassified Roseibium TaxID=2629323 RepID=UPI00273D2978|nr:asparaginase [Roseibium sp. MMSF_3544]
MTNLLVHTRGTISMVNGPHGFQPKTGVVEDFVNRELREKLRGHEIDVCVLSPLIDSANANPSDWNRIAQLISETHERYEGFVITHGTDTLAYTSAALCFALEGLAKPVVLTGSMLPLTVEGNDAASNMLGAFQCVLEAPSGVWVFFSGRRLHGARFYKTHSRKHDAFGSMASDRESIWRSPELAYHAAESARVGVIAVAPGMIESVLQFAATQCDGLVPRCYGSGTVSETQAFREALIAAKNRNVPVLAVSQCPEGGIALGTHAAGAVLVECNVIDGCEMTLETAYTKMVFALSIHSALEHKKAFLETSIAGEI